MRHDMVNLIGGGHAPFVEALAHDRHLAIRPHPAQRIPTFEAQRRLFPATRIATRPLTPAPLFRVPSTLGTRAARRQVRATRTWTGMKRCVGQMTLLDKLTLPS